MRFFPRATSLLKGATFINFDFFKNFLRIFNFLFLCMKESNCLLFNMDLRLFKGLCLLFLPNVPGTMFIQGGTFIPDSRVVMWVISSGGLAIYIKGLYKSCLITIQFNLIHDSLQLSICIILIIPSDYWQNNKIRDWFH